jgi:hypothetical protein
MKPEKDITQLVQKAMDSLDDIRRASPQPYFYTRLKARISRGNSWGTVAGFISRPVFALAMVSVVLFVNVWILYKSDNGVINPSNNNSLQAAATSDVPEEYNVAVSTFYDYETP